MHLESHNGYVLLRDCAIDNLRERKKAQTTTALVDSAYGLVAERGLGAVNADAVAARAGVSRRTFFNYFPSVEAALAHGIGEFLEDLKGRLNDRPADESVMESLELMLGGPADPAFLQRILQLGSVGAPDLQARAVLHGAVDAWLPWLIDHLRRRLPAGTDALYAVHLALAVTAGTQAAIHVWAERTDRALTPESCAEFQALLARNVHTLRTGFDAAAVV